MIKNIYQEENNVYKYENDIEDVSYNSYYILETGKINLYIFKDKNLIVEWNFYVDGKSLTYNAYDKGNVLYSFIYEDDNVKCITEKCEKTDEKIQYFCNYLYRLM